MDEKEYYNEGVTLLIDKPYKWTSFDIVKKIRNTIRIKKVGHAGTLDPLATGLLIVCTGRHTKKINQYQDQPKTYTGKLILGKTTPSFDLETDIDSETNIDHLTTKQIHETTKKFIGEISQIPPAFSAVKVNGVRAYKMARNNEEVKLEPRKVTVNDFTLTEISLPEVSFSIHCSKGTYIRSLVRDFGESLGVGAYMSELKRTKIGDFDVSAAQSIEEFVQEHIASKESSDEGLS